MTDQIRRALTELPDEIEIGGVKHKIPPLTITKLELLADQTDRLEEAKNLTGKDIKEIDKLRAVLGEAVRTFIIIIKPNNEDIAEPTEDEIKKAKNQITLTDIPTILRALHASMNFEGMLKNVPPPREASSPGAHLSPGSSSSLDGSSAISLTESALEV
jgi:hypothetical protein